MSRARVFTFTLIGLLAAVTALPLGSSEQERQRSPQGEAERRPPTSEREAVRRPPADQGEAVRRPPSDKGEAARRQPSPPHPVHRPPAVVVRGRVFIGGYFYDPVFGPYPWWPRTAYPYRYFPLFDHRAEVRLLVTPRQAAVYVDGFYAGIVDDFDGVFQALPLPPGGHTIAIYLEGYRTTRHSLYLRPGSSFKLRDSLAPLPPGERAEFPSVAPPLPPPPTGSYDVPTRTAPPVTSPTPPVGNAAVALGTLDIVVQPATAVVQIDGQLWRTSEPGHFIVQLPVGRHQVEISHTSYRTYTTDIDVRESEATPLNVALTPQP